MKRRTKAQAALEFLTTYGWALMAIIGVIGALTYFMGAGDIEDQVPARCSLGSEFYCQTSAIQEDGSVYLEMYPTKNVMNVSKIRCIYADGSNVTEEFGDMVLLPGKLVVVQACEGEDPDISGKEKLTVKLVYAENETDAFTHVADGEIVQNVIPDAGLDEDNLDYWPD